MTSALVLCSLGWLYGRRQQWRKPAPPFNLFEGSSPPKWCCGDQPDAGPLSSIDVVVAQYNASVEPLFRSLLLVAPVRTRVFVYHKGSEEHMQAQSEILQGALRDFSRTLGSSSQVQNLTVQAMPNVGRNDATYAHHIASHYDDLADLILFVKDTIWEHHYYGLAERLAHFVARPPRGVHAWCARSTREVSLNFALSYYLSEGCKRSRRRYNGTKCYGGDHRFALAGIRPLGKWMRSVGIAVVEGQMYCQGGNFAASRAAVRTWPAFRYASLNSSLSTLGDNSELGHFVERSWMTIFGAVGFVPTKIPHPCIYSASFVRPSEMLDSPCLGNKLKYVSCVFFAHERETFSLAMSHGWRPVKLWRLVEKFSPQFHDAPALFPIIFANWVAKLSFSDFAMYIEPQHVTVDVPSVLLSAQRDLLDANLAFPMSTRVTILKRCEQSYLSVTQGNDTVVHIEGPSAFVWRMTVLSSKLSDAWMKELQLLTQYCGFQAANANRYIRLALYGIGKHVSSRFHSHIRRIHSKSAELFASKDAVTTHIKTG